VIHSLVDTDAKGIETVLCAVGVEADEKLNVEYNVRQHRTTGCQRYGR
jgi:hypothetical protein